MEYPKINTLFKRDENNIIIPLEYTLPEFEYLKYCLFECTEKIDGTNIRIEFYKNDFNEPVINIKGRTDKSIIPNHLLKKLSEIFTLENLSKTFETIPDEKNKIILFGEGYGHKIQTPGDRYIKDDVNFILFDVYVGKWWLTRESCEKIANSLGIKIVPFIGYYNLEEAMQIVEKGFKSRISEDKTLDAEGLVLKTIYGLLDRNGNRIITKLKTTDFRKYKAKYGKTYF